MWRKIRSNPQWAGEGAILILVVGALLYYFWGIEKSLKDWVKNFPFGKVALYTVIGAVLIALGVIVWRWARSKGTSDLRSTIRDMYQKVSSGKSRMGPFCKMVLSIIFVHILLWLMLGTTYTNWWSNPVFVKFNLIIPTLGLVAVLLGEGLIFWLGVVGAGVWFISGMTNSDIKKAPVNAGNEGVQPAVSNISAGVSFEGNPRDHWMNGSDRDSILILLSSPEDSMLAEIAFAESGGNQYEDGTEKWSLRGKVDPDDTGALQINRRIHRKLIDSLASTADSSRYNVETLAGNLNFGKLLRDRKIAQGKTGFEVYEDWKQSACRWRDHYDPCPENGVRNQVFAISEVIDSIVTLPADGSFQGPIVVGDPRVFTYNLVPSRTVRFVFRYPNGREREFVDGVGRSNATGVVPSFHLRVTDGEEVTWKFSRIRLN